MSIYDVKGAVHRIEQRRESIPGLEYLLNHRLNHDAYDVEFSRTGEIVKVTHYLGSGGIHDTEQFLSDEAGTHFRTLRFDGDGSLTRSTDLLHDSHSRCVGWVAHDKAGVVEGRGNDQYAEELLVASESYTAAGIPVSQVSFEYAGNVLLKSLKKYYRPNGDLAEQWISRYDSEGRMEETFGLTANGRPLGNGKYKYEYDADGRKTRVWSFNDLATDDVPNAVSVFEYVLDDVGNWVERREHHRGRSSSRWGIRISRRRLAYWPV
jgi:hypothetical protein